MATVLAALLCSALTSSAAAAPGDVTVSQLANINPAGNADPGGLRNVNGTLFFGATDPTNGNELWRSEAPYTTATMFPNINSTPTVAANAFPGDFTSINGTVFFIADNGITGPEPWKSEPPYTATAPVADIDPGDDSPMDGFPDGSYPSWFVNANGTALFQASDGVNGAELWRSVASYTTATMLPNINSTPTVLADAFPSQLVNVNGTVLFNADNGTAGMELWKSEGPSYMTATLVADIDPGDDSPMDLLPDSSSPSGLVNVNGTLFFSASDGVNGLELWKSESPFMTATMVEDAVPGDGINAGDDSNPVELTNVNGTLFFRAEDGDTGDELWKIEPPFTTAMATRVADIRPGGNSSSLGNFAAVGSTLFFSAFDGVNGFELWKSNGGPLGAGTEMVADINPGAGSGNPQRVENLNGTLFFKANDGTNGEELWRSVAPYTSASLAANIATGNPAGTNLGASSEPTILTAVGDTLLFRANDGITGTEVWRATIEGPAAPVVTPPMTATPTTPTKKCKKGRKLKKGKCVKKKRKRRK